MNIEEERKAFSIHYLSENRSAYDEPDMSVKHGEFRCVIVNRSFGTWLSAKAHAAEMTKPVPKLDVMLWIADDNGDDIDRFYVYQPGWKSREFFTESEAIQWAKDNGYRVIEE